MIIMVIVILGSNSNDVNNVSDNYNKECGDKNDDNNNNDSDNDNINNNNYWRNGNDDNDNDNGNHYSDDSE